MSYIFNCVRNYIADSPVRFHMPGHKGKSIGDFRGDLFNYDVTELKETDNVYSPGQYGFVTRQLAYISSIFSSKASVISCGGATLCIQSAVYCAKKYYSLPFLVNVRCHTSVISALSLIDADVDFFTDECDLEQILQNTRYTVILTSPDYYGRMYDIKHYADLCHKYNCRLIVDNSHGAHFAFTPKVTHPIKLGADLVIDSLHKTLPTLTGGALLHSNCDIDTELMLEGIRLFGTSSPSYLISSSLCECIDYMKRYGVRSFSQLDVCIEKFTDILKDTSYRRVEYPICDPYRLVLTCDGVDMRQVDEHLRQNGVHSEFSDVDNLVLIPSINNDIEDFRKLYRALNTFQNTENELEHRQYLNVFDSFIKPVMKPSKVLFANSLRVSVEDCVGHIAAEMKFSYPPGMPYTLPGVRINENMQKMLKQSGSKTISTVAE